MHVSTRASGKTDSIPQGGLSGRPRRPPGCPGCHDGTCGSVSAHVDLIDIDDERHIDEVDFPRSGHPASSALSACHSLSYTTYTVFRQDVNKLRITDSTLQIDDSTLQIDDLTLQIGDSTLQIGDSTLQIVDLTLLPTSSKRRIDVTTRWIVDINDLPPCRKSISTIRNFKSTIRSFKSAIRSVPQWHASVTSPSRSVIRALQHSNQTTPSPKKGRVRSCGFHRVKTTSPCWRKI